MKNLTMRVLALLLALCTMVCMTAPAYADQDYTCSGYEDCTANGSEIYIVTRDNAPIREKASNKGKIIARAEKGDLIAVKRVFWTARLTRWCEVQTDTGEPLYIYIGNCKPEVHSFITLYESGDTGYVSFCPICGVAEAVANGESASCDLTCVADQIAKGSFSDYNPSFAGILGQIITGELLSPIVDTRDLVGDILNGEPGWLIAMDLAAFLPVVGAVKYAADDITVIGKNADDLAELGLRHADDLVGAAKKIEKIHWGTWEDYAKVWVDGRAYAQIGDYRYTEHAVTAFQNPSFQTNWIKNGKGFVEHSRGIPPTYVNWMLTEGRELGTTRVVDRVLLENGAERITYCNGTLYAVVENDEIVVTIFERAYDLTK